MKNEIVKVHDVDIECPFHDEQHFVAVRPICQALGIDPSPQIRDLKKDGILGSTVVNMLTTVAADGKQREMVCIPLKFVFGWLFTIDDDKVKPEARESLRKYKLLCYEALYERFMRPITNRQQVLLDKVKLQQEAKLLEDKLSNENPEFKRLQEIKAAIARTGTAIKNMDAEFVNTQLELFD